MVPVSQDDLMDKRRSRFVPGVAFVDECLERRVVLSGIGSAGAAEVVARTARDAPTKTSLTVSAGTLAQPITFTATVQAAASAGSPTGTVEILDHGQLIDTLTLSPATAKNARSAASEATATLTPSPGGGAYYFGKHPISAVYVPSGDFSKSTVNKTFTVSQPAYTTLAGGVKVATVASGSGAEIQPGQTANVLYTGYLAKNGQIFDDSNDHGDAPLSFAVGEGEVVPGFDEGTAGMTVGETRIISIPPAEGYGSTANGPIPANSTLIFVVTLESIS
jgi:FKBP-type peptidyl-prolyl cis-trans isomerase/Bacterial Ig-like domain (group 3)